MIRGISFEIPQITTDTLYKIFSTIDISKYCWYNIKNQTEVWDESLKKDFFCKEYYSSQDFLKCIQSNYYIVFLKLQAYSLSHNFKNICSYNDFIDSDCQLILLINDCEYVEIYSKDQNVLSAIFQAAINSNYNNIRYITDTNDGRTKMNIL